MLDQVRWADSLYDLNHFDIPFRLLTGYPCEMFMPLRAIFMFLVVNAFYTSG